MTASVDRTCYRFGRFAFQPAQRRLSAEGLAVPLTARAFDLLVVLVERAGQLVTKDELLERVWPGLVVEEGNLPVQVSNLRRVLGTEAIATVPGHGYRFTPEVDRSDEEPALAETRHHNLPCQLTTFVGREGDLAKCTHLLGRTRLLTLTGIGGLGKTRLSLEMAEGWLDEFADGVWLVELAPITDARLVAKAVASVLGVLEQAGRPVVETVMKFVSGRQLLLILDNCEHLLHACAEVAMRLLRAGSDVKVLATSREPLHVTGETTYPLSTLSVPDLHATVEVAALAEYEAVRLFVGCATAACPDFELTAGNAWAVHDICARLDGIPLALELAAARVRVLSVEAISLRLDDRFRLLKGGDQTALPRQQTLRATIDWSYDLLAAPAQALLRRLAVFAGGWTLEAAEAVGRGGEIDASDVLDLLFQLTERSLVVVQPDGTRYRLLETVRQYAQDRLDASGEGAATRTRHLDFHLMLAEEAEPQLLGPREESWHARLDLERENLRMAYAWCVDSDDGAEATLRLVSALRRWLCRGAFEMGSPVLAEALARAGAQNRNLLRCRGVFAAGYVSYYMGRYEDARRYGEESLAIARDVRVPTRVADALMLVGLACHGLDDHTGARRHLADAIVVAREAGDKLVLAEALNSLAELHSTEGDLLAARLLYDEALGCVRAADSCDFTTVILLNLARVSIGLEATERALELLRSAMELLRAIGSTRYAHVLLTTSAALAAMKGDWERAARFYGAADRQLEQIGFRREPADEAFLAPQIARAREVLGHAAFVASEGAGRTLGTEKALADAQSWLESVE